jgi:hypothetical protein
MAMKFCVVVDHNALRQYPHLDKLQRQLFPMKMLNEIMSCLEHREENFKIEFVHNILKLSLRNVDREGNDDHLGLPRIEGELKDICDIVRESTGFGTRNGIDPRTQIFYSRKSSILAGTNLTDNALLVPNCLPSRGVRKKHPLDLTSCEEVNQRRQLADRRWIEQKQRQKRSNNIMARKIENAKNFFDKKGSS